MTPSEKTSLSKVRFNHSEECLKSAETLLKDSDYKGAENETNRNLKKQVEETMNKEETKEVIEKAKMELTDEELDQVTGGGKAGKASKSPTVGSKKPIK